MRRLPLRPCLALTENARQGRETILAIVEPVGVRIGPSRDQAIARRQRRAAGNAGIGGIEQRLPIERTAALLCKFRVAIEKTVDRRGVAECSGHVNAVPGNFRMVLEQVERLSEPLGISGDVAEIGDRRQSEKAVCDLFGRRRAALGLLQMPLQPRPAGKAEFAGKHQLGILKAHCGRFGEVGKRPLPCTGIASLDGL